MALLLVRNGEVWYKLRRAVQQMMLRPKEVSYYYPLQDGVAERAVKRLAGMVDEDGKVPGLQNLVGKWILECEYYQDIDGLIKNMIHLTNTRNEQWYDCGGSDGKSEGGEDGGIQLESFRVELEDTKSVGIEVSESVHSFVTPVAWVWKSSTYFNEIIVS